MNNDWLRYNTIALFPRKQRFCPGKIFIVFIALCAVFTLLRNENAFAQKGQIVKLRVVKSIPNKDDEVILAGPADLDIDEGGVLVHRELDKKVF